MKVIRRPLVDLAALLTICGVCRTAAAQKSVALPGPNGTAAQTAQTEPPQRDPQRDSGESGEKRKGSRRTDHFRIGVLGGVGFPRPLSIEGMAKFENMVGVGVEYSLLPELTISNVRTSFYAVAADVRLFPFKDAFFVGVRMGRQHLGGDGTVTVSNYGSLHESVAIDTTFINPRLGFLWTWDPGVTLGIDAGAQVPLSASSSSSIPTNLPIGTDVSDRISSVTDSFGKSTLPTVDLLKIGVLL
jgi:hypothetical protein